MNCFSLWSLNNQGMFLVAISGSDLWVPYCIKVWISNEKGQWRGSDAVEMGGNKKTWDRLVMQTFLLSGKPFRRKEERIKQENESSTQLGEGKAPGKWLPAKKMFRQRKEESDVQSWGQQCKVFQRAFYDRTWDLKKSKGGSITLFIHWKVQCPSSSDGYSPGGEQRN